MNTDTLNFTIDSMKNVVNDCCRIFSDKAAITYTPQIENNYNVLIIVIGVLLFVFIVSLFLYLSSKNKHIHELELKSLDREKEERKQLLEFCYKLAEKKESETKEKPDQYSTTTKKTTTKTTNSTNENKEVVSTEIQIEEKKQNYDLIQDSPSNKQNETITLNQIRCECWKIIKAMNNINSLT